MLRGLVAGFKKILPPIITAYSRWAGGYDMRNSIRQQLDNMGIDAWRLEGAQKISTQGGVEILHEYLVGGEGFDRDIGDEVYVVVLASANKDILGIAYKSREELGTETYDNLRNAFEMAETDMTDAIWSMCMSRFSLTLTVSTSAGLTTISDGSVNITIDTTTHAMKYGASGLWTNDTTTEYTTLQANGWLTDGVYGPYNIPSQENTVWTGVVNSIENKSKIVYTITTTQESGYILISDGVNGIELKTSPTTLRYHADYYTESSDVSTEYSTITTNGWDIVGTYNYASIDDKKTVFDSLIASLKTKGIANATITHDTTNGEITMTNGQRSVTIADKNVGATTVYNNGDAVSEANCGKYFQRGNNNGFNFSGTLTKSSTKVDTTGYGPGNYYIGTDYITGDDWSNPSNDNLRGNVTNTEFARQGPCPSGYHIPNSEERQNFVNLYKVIRPNNLSGVDVKNTFNLPFVGLRKSSDGNINFKNYFAYYWASPILSSVNAYYFVIGQTSGAGTTGAGHRCYGYAIRPFKNTYTLIPINQLRSTFGNTTAVENEMNSHPYDYYLLGGCTTPLTLASGAGAMRRVYASYDTNTNTWSVQEVS